MFLGIKPLWASENDKIGRREKMYKKGELSQLFTGVLLLSLFLLFSASVSYAIPQFIGATVSVANGTAWQSITKNYGFQVNITNLTGTTETIYDIDPKGIIVQIGRAGTTKTNYTSSSTGITTFSNDTHGMFWINVTASQFSSAGSGNQIPNITFYANNSIGEWAMSLPIEYNLSINTSTGDFMNLTLGNSTQSMRVSANATVPYVTNNVTGLYTASVFVGNALTFTLYRNLTNVTMDNPASDRTFIGFGVKTNYTYVCPGNANFSAATKGSFYLNITKLMRTTDWMLVLVDGINANTTYDPTGPRTTNVTSHINLTENTMTLNLTRDTIGMSYTLIGSSNPQSDVQNLNYSFYYYSFYFAGNANMTDGNVTRSVSLNPYSPSGGGGGGGIVTSTQTATSIPPLGITIPTGGILDQEIFGVQFKWILLAIIGLVILKWMRIF